jgi:hypothetical protein
MNIVGKTLGAITVQVIGMAIGIHFSALSLAQTIGITLLLSFCLTRQGYRLYCMCESNRYQSFQILIVALLYYF